MKKITILFTVLLFAVSSLDASYTLQISKRAKSKIDRMPKNKVSDMKQIPQDPAYYAKQVKPMSKSKQKKLDREFNKKYFKPWDLKKLDITKQDFGWEKRFVTKKKI